MNVAVVDVCIAAVVGVDFDSDVVDVVDTVDSVFFLQASGHSFGWFVAI